MRFVFALLLSLFAIHADAQQFTPFAGGNAPNTFAVLGIGGGGLITGANINPTDGTRLIRTDAYGCYNIQGGQWNQLVVESGIPSANFGYSPAPGTSQLQQNGGGCYEVSSAPTNSSDVFIVLNPPLSSAANAGEVFFSSNKGATFKATNFQSGCPAALPPNDTSRINGPKMAVGLQSADLVYVGTLTNGMCVSVNATQATPAWGAVGGLPTSGTGYNIVFDPSDVTGHTAYACVPANGVYVTNDAQDGTSSVWTKVTVTSMPTSCQRIAMAGSTGVLLVVSGAAAANGNFDYYTPSSPGSPTGVWTVNPGGISAGWHSVAADPASCSAMASCHIAVYSNAANNMILTQNGGSSWNAVTSSTRVCTGTGQPPWQCNLAQEAGEQADIAFEIGGPNGTAGVLDITGGQAFWTTTPPTSGSVITLNVFIAGVEEVVPLQVIAPNGVPVTGSEDVGVFQLTPGGGYPSLTNNFNSGAALLNGWAIDYASTNHNFMVDINGPQGISGYDYSGTSSDGGSTWTPFNTFNFSVAATALNPCTITTSAVCVTLPSSAVASALTNWSNGSGSILTVLAFGGTSVGIPGVAGNNFPVTVNPSGECTAPCALFQNSSWQAAYRTTGGNYLMFLASRAISNYSGNLNVTNVTSSSGSVQITWTGVVAVKTGDLVCVKNVVMATTTQVNGCWVFSNQNTNSKFGVLFGSTFVGGDSYVSGGEVDETPGNGGAMAAASTTNFIWVPSNVSAPYCTQDGGQTWLDLTPQMATIGVPAFGAISSIVGNGTTLTITTATPVNMTTLASNNTFTIANSSGGTFNGTFTATGGSGNTVTASSAIVGSVGAGGTFIPIRNGWPTQYFSPSHIVVADRVTPNTFYLYNFLAGIVTVTNCTVNSIVNSGSLANNSAAAHKFGVNSGGSTMMKSVDGQAGHFFFTVGPQGNPHPAPQGLWRSCDNGVTMTEYSQFFEVEKFGFGAIKPGQSYASEYVVGWYDAGGVRATAVYGIYQSFDDPNNGVTSGACNVATQTWKQLLPSANGQTWPLNWMAGMSDITGSNIYGQIFSGIGAGGGFVSGYFPYNFLLEGDLHRGAPANDNDADPVGLNKAA